MKFLRRGVRKVVLPANSGVVAGEEPQYEAPILAALSKAFHWQRLLDDGTVESGSEIARKEGLHPTTVNELLRFTRLVPSVVQAILAGRQPRTLSLIWLKNHELPWSWDGQETLFGGFDAGSAGVVAREPARASACRGRKRYAADPPHF
ncbi:hypothetical protein [Verminephrobacter eiseniae]|uniref:hypothetical protein n=1 Tax=Verminephrobacter eiseniae TaxID=364317 RepID=UPI0022386F17|nr:hypothetical protein [Verminephrobacter eiseniae]